MAKLMQKRNRGGKKVTAELNLKTSGNKKVTAELKFKNRKARKYKTTPSICSHMVTMSHFTGKCEPIHRCF